MAKIPSGDPGDPPVSEAIASRDLAIEAAIEREDWYPTAALAMDQVYPHHELQCFDSARHYAELALEACSMTDLRATGLRKIELDALDMSALEHFYLGNFEQAAAYIASASHVAHLGTHEPKVLAGIEWTAALIDRVRGEAFAALHHALNSLELYTPLDSPLNVARLRVVIADIALDIATSFTPEHGDTHNDFIGLAATHLAKSMKPNAMPGDAAGRALANLTYVRLSRLSNANDDRLTLLETLARRASTLEDLPLVGQVQTALGDELAYLGNMHAAIQHYGRAIESLNRSDAPVLAIWPKRALLRYQEQVPRK